MNNLAQLIKKAGLKVTAPRLQILKYFESSPIHHVNAEELYRYLQDKGEALGLATVYRVLNQFDEAGLITRHNFEGGSAVFERNQHSHDHIICQRCGKIIEFDDPIINARVEEIASSYQLRLTDKELCLYGLCQEHADPNQT
ncbi:ferric iron uptake transcriptional regulator [Celerinatantimonas sp. YJH-8]|uniref:ferric iron uptake transcriptional regulator n=1 Tax=Celerinatantimonas sp. YJH-8 TaxID=3228714 RepID=UPI0038C1397C